MLIQGGRFNFLYVSCLMLRLCCMCFCMCMFLYLSLCVCVYVCMCVCVYVCVRVFSFSFSVLWFLFLVKQNFLVYKAIIVEVLTQRHLALKCTLAISCPHLHKNVQLRKV